MGNLTSSQVNLDLQLLLKLFLVSLCSTVECFIIWYLNWLHISTSVLRDHPLGPGEKGRLWLLLCLAPRRLTLDGLLQLLLTDQQLAHGVQAVLGHVVRVAANPGGAAAARAKGTLEGAALGRNAVLEEFDGDNEGLVLRDELPDEGVRLDEPLHLLVVLGHLGLKDLLVDLDQGLEVIDL